MPHRPTYLLPVKYNPSPNQAIEFQQMFNDEAPIQPVEAEYQISFKVVLLEHLLSNNDELSAAYSQQSFWQLYNNQHSHFVRDTNYEPELFYTLKAAEHTQFGFFRPLSASIGIVHESNGQIDLLSRSWNRVYLDLMASIGDWRISLKPWYRLKEDAEIDDNPDIYKYLGYGELRSWWKLDNHHFELMLRNNLRTDDNKGAIDLRWAYPITRDLALYAKYFNGYGESLFDYNVHNESLGLGIALNSWDWQFDQLSPGRGWQGPRVYPYRTQYLLPAKYNPAPNQPEFTIPDQESDNPVQRWESEFQISFKLVFWEHLFTERDDLSLAYSQQSFWQIYNERYSRPFRETNYEPELIYTLSANPAWRNGAFYHRSTSLGFVHEANGQGGEWSRGWDRIYLQLETGFYNGYVGLKPWYRLPVASSKDDNPDIEKYMGYGELYLHGDFGKHNIDITLRNNLRGHGNKGAIDLRWSYPISREFALYAKYFNGYGESLIDYNKHNQSLGLGFALLPWSVK